MKKHLLRNIIIVILALLAAFSFYQYMKAKERVGVLSNPELNSEYVLKERDRIVSRVEKLMLLPEGKEPDLAIVQDVENLRKDQPFFNYAEDGDKVLIYPDRAIIYRESDNLIINMSPVTTSTADLEDIATSQEEESASPADEVADDLISIDIRNGSGVAGSAGRLGNTLDEDYDVAAIGDAAQNTYQQTIIVNLSNVDISELAKQLEAEVVQELPPGEATSSADIVIILGKE